VLNSEPDSPRSLLVDTIRTQHAQLQDQIAKGQSRIQQLSTAKSQFELLERACVQKRQELASAESQLVELARPLGHVTFQAHRAGEVGNQPCFADRIALHERIEALQKEHERLTPPGGASLLQKTKAKAQQLVVVGKIKIEELRIASQEKEIGKSLLDSGTEHTAASATTAAVLDQVRQQRAVITKLGTEAGSARFAFDSKKVEFCRNLGLSRVENAAAFDAEVRLCNARIGHAQQELTALEGEIPDRLTADPGKMDTPLAGLLCELEQANAQATWLGQKEGSSKAMETAALAGPGKTQQRGTSTSDAAKQSPSGGPLAHAGSRWRKLASLKVVAVGAIALGALFGAVIFSGAFNRGKTVQPHSGAVDELAQTEPVPNTAKAHSAQPKRDIAARQQDSNTYTGHTAGPGNNELASNGLPHQEEEASSSAEAGLAQGTVPGNRPTPAVMKELLRGLKASDWPPQEWSCHIGPDGL